MVPAMAPIPVRYNPLFGGIFLGGAAMVLMVGLFVGKGMLLGIGLINALTSIGFLLQPWMVVHPDRVEMKNLFGMTLKSYPLSKPSDLRIEANKIFVPGKDGSIGGGLLARSSDLELLKKTFGV